MTDILIHNKFKFEGESNSKSSLLNKLKDKKDYYDFLISWFDKSDFIHANTSGSTGKPKKIKLKKTDLIASAKLTAKYFNLSPGDRLINCLPIKYIAGKMMLVRALVLGLDIYLYPVNSTPLLNLKNDFDFVGLTPMQLENSLKYIGKIKNVIVGGSAVNQALREKILSIDSNVFETYGMTETITHIAIKNLSKNQSEFTLLPGIKIYKKNNCLLIKPGHLSIDFVQTNDVVHLTSSNKFILLGRKDFIINSGGIKINPETVEQKLSKYYSSDFIISSLSNDKLGDEVVIVFKENIPENYKDAFKKLDKYEVPKKVFLLDTFPKNNGKINRNQIKNNINLN